MITSKSIKGGTEEANTFIWDHETQLQLSNQVGLVLNVQATGQARWALAPEKLHKKSIMSFDYIFEATPAIWSLQLYDWNFLIFSGTPQSR